MNAPWLIAMDWRETLFLHWPVAADALRPMIPPDVELDVFDGSAWISIVAFNIAHARPRGAPARLSAPAFGEINVRTYVTRDDKPGIWFFSLDAASTLTVEAGRSIFHLPYRRAQIDIAWDGTNCAYRCERTDTRAEPARFTATGRIHGDERIASRGSLEHRLVERYCFYTSDRHGRTLRLDVTHPSWPLRDATVEITDNTLLAAAKIRPSPVAPLAHASTGVSTRARPLVAPRR